RLIVPSLAITGRASGRKVGILGLGRAFEHADTIDVSCHRRHGVGCYLHSGEEPPKSIGLHPEDNRDRALALAVEGVLEPRCRHSGWKSGQRVEVLLPVPRTSLIVHPSAEQMR
ncbi:MAG: hypothetical protein ACXW4O_17830, partial [Candidatus Binatia bacterium]